MSITDSNPTRAAFLDRKWDNTAGSLRPMEEMSSRERWEQALAYDWDQSTYARRYGDKAMVLMESIREAARKNKVDKMCKLASELSAHLRSERPNLFGIGSHHGSHK